MFRTPVKVSSSPQKIKIGSSVLSIGSCFAQTIGKRLIENKFKAINNPFGTLFNPASIFSILHESLNNYMPAEDSYLQRDGLHYNYKLHSNFVASSKEALQNLIEDNMNHTRKFMEKVDWVIITLGTAYCYEKNESGKIVANCHKMPPKNFNRRLLSPEEIQTRFEQLYLASNLFNKKARFIFTVSPVRHIRDTLVQNSVSKASLRLAIDQIVKQHPDNTHYFPSYEIMMDDLRDYRFYKEDMIHPTEVAENYIWDQWIEAYLDEEAKAFIPEWQKIKKAIAHRPFNPASEKHRQFILKTIEKLNALSNKVDVSDELHALKKQL